MRCGQFLAVMTQGFEGHVRGIGPREQSAFRAFRPFLQFGWRIGAPAGGAIDRCRKVQLIERDIGQRS